MAGFVTADQVRVGVEVSSREEALRYLADLGVECGFATDADALYAAFLAREAEGETGLTDGFATPHAKSAAITTAGITFVKFTSTLDWPSFDKGPVDIALALYVPDGEAGTTHLRLLSKAAVMLMKAPNREKLRACDDPEELAAFISAGLA